MPSTTSSAQAVGRQQNTENPMKKILIVEDIPEARTLLESTVRLAFPECMYDSCGTIQEGLLAASTCRYDLAMLDIQLPDGSGFEVLGEIMLRHPATICVVTTILADDDTIVEALTAGAQGYLLKEQPQAIQVRQLTQLREGIPALSPPIARRILQHFRRQNPTLTATHNLTPREVEVLTHIARGSRIHEVAIRLDLSENTIASYVKTIYRKLNISSRAEAAIRGKQFGLI
jgi:DNA-binding NarL/FixJ family response regulator